MINWLRGVFGSSANKNAPKTPPPLPKSVAPAPLPVKPAVSAPTPVPVTPDEDEKKKPDAARDKILAGTAPEGMQVRMLDLSGISTPFQLPRRLQCFGLNASKSSLAELPVDLQVEYKIDLTGCAKLTSLPGGLKTGNLTLNQCINLRSLPENLEVNFLNMEGCAALTDWPDSARVSVGSVDARNCASLKSLPHSLGPLTNLDLSGCRQISSLPAGLQINGWLDLAGTQIVGLPDSLQGVQLRWRGVLINARIAFFPETLTPAEILDEQNAEVRRVMMERVGLANFIKGANATVLDEDTDPGGKRQLLKIPLKSDEDLVCVSLYCPSTGRHYIIRVPPAMKTCRQAVAWTAGYDNPEEYNPLIET